VDASVGPDPTAEARRKAAPNPDVAPTPRP
jgi:hypothetical protein